MKDFADELSTDVIVASNGRYNERRTPPASYQRWIEANPPTDEEIISACGLFGWDVQRIRATKQTEQQTDRQTRKKQFENERERRIRQYQFDVANERENYHIPYPAELLSVKDSAGEFDLTPVRVSQSRRSLAE